MSGPLSPAPDRLVRTPGLWTLYAILGLYAFLQNSLGPAVPFLRAEFHLDYTWAALHISAFAVGMIVAGVTAPAWIERFGPRSALWGGQLGTLAGITVLVLAPAPWVSLIGILIAGLVGTFSQAALQSSIATLAGPHRAKALLESGVAASLTSAAGPFVLVLGVALGSGWRTLWPVFVAALALVYLVGRAPLKREVPDRPARAAEGPVRSPLPRAYLRYWLLILIGVSVEWCVGFWAAEYLKGLPGGSVSLAAAGAGVFQLSAVVSRIVSSRLTARWGERRLLGLALAMAALGFPLYWSLANAVTAFAGLILCGLGVAVFYPVGLSLGLGAAGTQGARASSLASGAAGLAVLGAPLGLGALADTWGLGTALFAIPAGLLLMTVLLLIRRRAQPGS